MLTLVLAVLLFLLLIFPHELGHFIAARAVGIRVNEFAFGMGPAIWKKQGKETLYSVRLFPVGGFCAMEGEDEDTDDDRSFLKKPAWARIAVLLSGALMNVLICFLVVTILFTVYGHTTQNIVKVEPESPAYGAGIRAGDVITEVNGNRSEPWSNLISAVSGGQKEIKMSCRRDGQEKEFTLIPEIKDGKYIVGIEVAVSHSPFSAMRIGIKETWGMAGEMFRALKSLFSGAVSVRELSGPVGIVSLVHETASTGAFSFFYLLAFISMNLAVVNLLPIPALDGGRILFILIRKVTKGAVSDHAEAIVNGIGLLFLLGLMVFVTWNDILRLIQK